MSQCFVYQFHYFSALYKSQRKWLHAYLLATVALYSESVSCISNAFNDVGTLPRSVSA